MWLSLVKPFIIILLFFVLITFKAGIASDFTGEVIYLIMTDRFCDGDTDNNPPNTLFSSDHSNWKLYWGGDFEGIIYRLPYIKQLGITAIWITPIIENPERLYRYGEETIAPYHGYWGMDFKRINRFFGTKEKFKELIDKAHSINIKVVLDIVLNHTSPIGQGVDGAIYDDGKFVADYSNDPDGWFHHNGSIDFSNLDPREWQEKNLFDLADLNQDNPLVDKYLKDYVKYWVSFGIDALRLDTVRHISPSWLADFAKEMHSFKPDLFIFGEWSMGGADVEGAVEFARETGISIIDFSLQKTIVKVIAQGESFILIPKLLANDKNLPDPYTTVTCIDNHDLPRFLSTAIASGNSVKKASKLLEMATYLLLTTRGIPCIYYGTEQFLHNQTISTWGIGGEPYNREMMKDFNLEGNTFASNIKKLSQLRQINSALRRGIQKTVKVTKDVYIYERLLERDVVLVALNKGRERVAFTLPTSLPDGKYGEGKIIGKDITVKSGKTTIILNPLEVGIWEYHSCR